MIEIINMLIYFKMDSRWMQVFMNGFFMLFTYSLILINREKRVEGMFLGFSNLGEIHLLLKPFQRWKKKKLDCSFFFVLGKTNPLSQSSSTNWIKYACNNTFLTICKCIHMQMLQHSSKWIQKNKYLFN